MLHEQEPNRILAAKRGCPGRATILGGDAVRWPWAMGMRHAIEAKQSEPVPGSLSGWNTLQSASDEGRPALAGVGSPDVRRGSSPQPQLHVGPMWLRARSTFAGLLGPLRLTLHLPAWGPWRAGHQPERETSAASHGIPSTVSDRFMSAEGPVGEARSPNDRPGDMVKWEGGWSKGRCSNASEGSTVEKRENRP